MASKQGTTYVPRPHLQPPPLTKTTTTPLSSSSIPHHHHLPPSSRPRHHRPPPPPPAPACRRRYGLITANHHLLHPPPPPSPLPPLACPLLCTTLPLFRRNRAQVARFSVARTKPTPDRVRVLHWIVVSPRSRRSIFTLSLRARPLDPADLNKFSNTFTTCSYPIYTSYIAAEPPAHLIIYL